MKIGRLPSWANLAPLALLGFLAFVGIAGAEVLPPGFVSESVLQDPNVVIHPTQIAFFPDGRMLIATKGGQVWLAKNGVVNSAKVWDGLAEVDGEVDRGLLGIAIDPDFQTNRYVYFVYTVDPDSIEGNAPSTLLFCRLTRYQMSLASPDQVDPSTRTVLIGRTWTDGVLNTRQSHSAGSLRWGRDKSLLVSFGDGAHWNNADFGGQDSQAFIPGRTDPIEDIGAYRAQFLGSLCGKILRINPHTGYGYASNPYADDNLASARSRVYQYGLRNPYRFVVKPGTGDPDTAAGNPGVLYIGDTGWNTWEDICVADQPGINFGWPCHEGPNPNLPYQNATPPAHHGCASIGTIDNPGPLRGPIISWVRVVADTSASVPPGYRGNICVGGEFYTGYQYPSAYRGRFFYGEMGLEWIAMATVNPSNQLVSAQYFANPADSPVDIEVDPWTGDLYYIAIFAGPNFWGEVRRVRWTGTPSNDPPTAEITDSPPPYSQGQTLNFAGSAADAEDPPPALVQQWKVDRVANGVIDPEATVAFGGSTSFVAGSGSAAYEVYFIVYDTDGKSDTALVVVPPDSTVVGVPVLRPTALSVSEAFPNPSAQGTAFTVEAPRAVRLEWRVFDVNGRELWRQGRGLDPGVWTLSWNGEDVRGRRSKPGLYFARVSVGGRTFVRRFTLVR